MNNDLGIVSLILGSMLAGCGTTKSIQPVWALPRKDLLDFLIDGSTRCNDLDDHLGAHSESYENGRLITYRIAEDGQQRYSVVKGYNWSGARYSLVITCGSEGIVTHHALVDVKQRT